jgi:poly(A) polymerase
VDRKRLTLDAARETAPDDLSPEALAYAVGPEAAVDRLLLRDRPEAARRLTGWERPPFPLGGGELIALGLPPGPAVARTMQALEQQWVADGFPDRDMVLAMARAAVGDR